MALNTSLQKVYRAHHDGRRKPNFAINEEVRGRMLSQWIGSGKEVCDLGCRDGQLTQHYLQGNRVVGCEIDPVAAARAVERGIDVRMTDLNQTLDFPDQSFDVVCACEVLEHLPYWDISVSEAVRVMRKGGFLIGTIPISYHLTDRWRVVRGKVLLSAKDPTHVKFLPFDEFLSTMAGYGLELVEYQIIEGGGPWRSRHPRWFARNIAFRFCKPG
jgi:SAM-dependent methyltransferase